MSGKDMYYLMHEDDVVTLMRMEEVSGSIVEISSKIQTELLPPGGNLSREELKRWWKRRAVPMKQGDMETILRNRGISTVESLLLRNCGLSLSDHYWMKPVESEITWREINLFTNDFVDEIGNLQIHSDGDTDEAAEFPEKGFYAPSASVQGELRKKWIIKNGKRYLIKGNYGISNQQSINEVIATILHQKQGKMPYTSYQLCDIEINGEAALGCICENFVTIETEFISAYDVCKSVKKDNAMSEYEHFISICVQNGMEEETVRMFLEYQILTDFVITNTDRHFNNFGVLRDAKSLKFISMAPIFDSGNSMFWNCSGLPKNNDLLNIRVNSFRKKETELLQYVTNPSQIQIRNLPHIDVVKELLMKDIDFNAKMEGILLGYQKKIELLDQLQNGKKIWKYGYGRE